jgi:DNA invertase Pin-like site-specific DNA recombinase
VLDGNNNGIGEIEGMKAAIYCRVSTEEQNTSSQLAACQLHCQRNEIEVFRTYVDNGVSGTRESRPAFNELLADMRQYKFNAIVITKLDRLARSLQHLLRLIDEFNVLGVHLIATTQGIDTHSATGKLQLQIMGAFAEFERTLISERTKEGLVGKKLVGKRGTDKKPRLKRVGVRTRLK